MTYRHAKDIAWNSYEDKAIIVQLGSERQFHELNATAAFLWQQCKEPKTDSQIKEALIKEFDVDTDQASQDVQEFIQTSLALNILQSQEI